MTDIKRIFNSTFGTNRHPEYKIRLQNNRGCIICDFQDWEKAKDIKWKIIDSKVVNLLGKSFESYLGIKGISIDRNPLNKKRSNYR